MNVTVEQLRAALEEQGYGPVKQIGQGYRAHCPAHGDENPSLEFREGVNGSAVVTCRSQGCDYESILRALGLWQERAELEPNWTPAGRAVQTYDYRDEQGELLYQVCRTADKRFLVRRPDLEHPGRYLWGLGDTRRVLFQLPELLPAIGRGDHVYLCEGEKDALALAAAGVVATCSPFGASGWRDDYADSLLDARLVVIVADKDEEGHRYATAVAVSLQRRQVAFRLVQAAAGNDASDHLAAGRSVEEFEPVDLPRDGDGETPERKLATRTVAEILAEPEPSAADLLVGPLVVRGQRLLIGGQSGEGKTTFALALARAVAIGGDFLDWTAAGGGRVLIVDAEQGARTIRRRLLEAGLDKAGNLIDYLAVGDGLSLDRDDGERAELEAVFERGRYDLLILDPLYKLHRGDGNSEQEMGALMRVLDGWRQRYGFALVLPAHMRKPLHERNKPTKHDISGSAAVAYGAEVTVILQRIRDGVSKLHFVKDRDGDLPNGTSWQLTFDRERGFRRDLEAEKPKVGCTEQVGAILRQQPGLSYDQIRERTKNTSKGDKPYSDKAVRDAVTDLRCDYTTADDGKTRLWSHPSEEAP